MTLADALTHAFASDEEDQAAAVEAGRFVLSGEHISISLSSHLQEDGFLVTGMLRGIMGNLDYSRINTIKMFESIEQQAAQPGHGGQPRGFSDAQQILLKNLEQQLLNIADVSDDIKTFWSQVNDNPSFNVHPRTDAQILTSIMAAEARKEEEKLAKFRHMQEVGGTFERDDVSSRKAAILARFGK